MVARIERVGEACTVHLQGGAAELLGWEGRDGHAGWTVESRSASERGGGGRARNGEGIPVRMGARWESRTSYDLFSLCCRYSSTTRVLRW